MSVPAVQVQRECLDALRRVRCDAVCLRNAGIGMRVILRGTEEDDVGYYEVCVHTDTPLLKRVCNNSLCDGYFEDDDETFVLEEFTVPLTETAEMTTTSEKDDLVDFLNAVLTYTVCPCATSFVKDRCDRCIACHLTLPPDDPEKHIECPVCYERVAAHPAWISVCGECTQTLCARCAARVTKCPMCRVATE